MALLQLGSLPECSSLYSPSLNLSRNIRPLSTQYWDSIMSLGNFLSTESPIYPLANGSVCLMKWEGCQKTRCGGSHTQFYTHDQHTHTPMYIRYTGLLDGNVLTNLPIKQAVHVMTGLQRYWRHLNLSKEGESNKTRSRNPHGSF